MLTRKHKKNKPVIYFDISVCHGVILKPHQL